MCYDRKVTSSVVRRQILTAVVWGACLAGCTRAGFGPRSTTSDLFPADTVAARDAARDAASDALAAADSGPDADPQATPGPIAACSSPCPGVTDCDALPDYRDPEPGRCNELLYEQTFAGPTSGWTITGGTWSWPAGWLAQDSTKLEQAWARAADAGLATTDYLVEARIRLGAVVTDATFYNVAVVGRYVHKDRYILGGITLYPDWGMTKPELWVVVRRDARPAVYKDPDNSGWSAGYPSVALPGYTEPTFDASPGKEHYLQLWYTQSPKEMITCRLLDETHTERTAIYALFNYPTYKQHLPTEPGSVGFHTDSRAVSIDFIRVFQLHETAPP